MNLIPLPFQKALNTYLPIAPLKGFLGCENLPIAYLNLINRVNGGYTLKSYCPTTEPTEDGLNIVDIPYIAGLFDRKTVKPYCIPSLIYQKQFHHSQDLSKNEIIFYEDHDRVAYFKYTKASMPNEPEVWYQDFIIGQTLKLADTMGEFLDKLEIRHFTLEQQGLHSYHRANREFLLAETPEELNHVFTLTRTTSDKEWYFEWINYFLREGSDYFRSVALKAMHYQEKHYPHDLPHNYLQGMPNSPSNSKN